MAKASFMQNKKGFTLIELLVVVAIIGLLATLGVIAFRDAQKKGRDTKRMGDAKALVNALAQASQEGMEIKDGACATAWPIITGTAKSPTTLWICDTAGNDQTKTFINSAALKDPLKGGGTACTGANVDCDYAIRGTASNFELYFYTEIGTAAFPVGAHTANQNGILK